MLQRLQLPPGLDGSIWRYANLAAANRRHRHAELELNLVTSGRGTYLLGNRRYEIRRGDLLWLFPAQEHVLIEQTPDFGMWIGVFRRRAIKASAVDAGARALLQRSYSGETCRRLTQQDLDRIEKTCIEISATAAEESGLRNAGLRYVLLHAWKYFQNATDVPVHTLHPGVERAASLIRNGGDSLGLETIAAEVGLSASRLSRLFKQQTGSSLVDLRNRQRIERFQQIYEKDRRHTLLDAALEAGFGSYPQFHRVCRQILGCSPGQYARHHGRS